MAITAELGAPSAGGLNERRVTPLHRSSSAETRNKSGRLAMLFEPRFGLSSTATRRANFVTTIIGLPLRAIGLIPYSR